MPCLLLLLVLGLVLGGTDLVLGSQVVVLLLVLVGHLLPCGTGKLANLKIPRSQDASARVSVERVRWFKGAWHIMCEQP